MTHLKPRLEDQHQAHLKQQQRSRTVHNPIHKSTTDLTPCSFDQSSTVEKATLYQATPGCPYTNCSTSCAWSPQRDPSSKITGGPTNLPPKRHTRLQRHLRLVIFTVYYRLFSFIFFVNAIGLLILFWERNVSTINLNHVATWATTNFLISILIRHDSIINLLFRSTWLVPWSVPLRVRRLAACVYTYGGIHSGAAVAGSLWFFAFTALLTLRLTQEEVYAVPVLVCTWLIGTLLLIILVMSLPALRSRYHNGFELAHRFLGWSSILLLWAQIVLLAEYSAYIRGTPSLTTLAREPTFWNLALITALLVHPWSLLRKWTFYPERLSAHALRLHFKHPVHRFSCLSISSSPLREWHPLCYFPVANH